MNKPESKIKILNTILPAIYFGFDFKDEPVPVLAIDIKNAKGAAKEKNYLHENLFPIEEISAIIRQAKDTEGESSSPFLIITQGIAEGEHNKHRKRPGEMYVGLHLLGVGESVGDAMILKATEMILSENGEKNVLFKINNIGGKTAQAQFQKEGTAYYRKHISELSPELRQLFKKSLFELYTKGKEECLEIHENAPEPMDFLAEDTRTEFSDLLEFIEQSEIPYEVDCHLLGDPNYSSHTVFEVINTKTNKIIAAGSRYNLLAKKIGFKKDLPGFSVLIKVKEGKTISQKTLSKFEKSKLFLIHIGKEAKIKSLKLIAQLAEAGIYLNHSIYRDKITIQLQMAKNSGASHHIIIGHKEALESSAIVRDSQGRAQKTIKFGELPEHIKGLK